MERNLTMIALFAALIAGLGLIPKFTLAFGVPITAQTLGVMLCGTVLGARRGALAALLFVALVALGLPLLAGGRGGLGVFASPTVGFLVSWPLAAFVTGLIVERWRGRLALVAAVASLVGGIAVVYAFGIVGMSVTLGKTLPEAALLVTAFLPGRCPPRPVLAGLITSALARARPASVLSRA